MSDKHLLDVLQMAHFVADGYLQLDGLLSADVCAQIKDDLESGRVRQTWPHFHGVPADQRPGQPLDNCFKGTAVGEAIRSDAVAGVLQSLVGPKAIYDHHAFHITQPGMGGQSLHYDAIIDFRLDFDIELLAFLQDTTHEMGGTRIVPGSHLRPTVDLSRMQHVVGERQIVCPVGTVVAIHQGMWHSGMRNRSDRTRHMFKLRVNPSVLQTRLWDTSSMDRPAVDDELREILTADHGWEGGDLRHEIVRRIRLWRLVSGDDTYDTESWVRRTTFAPSGRRL
jgi:hypothetical protein